MLKRTDDPLRDFEWYEDYCREQLEKIPECSECGSKIYDDHFYRIGGEIYCQDCINNAKEYLY